MYVNLDKHDITMICEALEFMAQDIIHAEQNGQTVAYSQDDVENLITFYTNVPVGSNDFYGLFGVHYAEVTTAETLVNGTYGNKDLFGAQIGFGAKKGNIKYELSYSNFESISLASTSGKSTVSADADALTFKIAVGF